MVLLPGCKCCGGGGPCWKCYGKYIGDWISCDSRPSCVINENEAFLPSYITFKSNLSVSGNPYGINDWLNGLEFRAVFSSNPLAKQSFSVRSAFERFTCDQYRPDLWNGGFCDRGDELQPGEGFGDNLTYLDNYVQCDRLNIGITGSSGSAGQVRTPVCNGDWVLVFNKPKTLFIDPTQYSQSWLIEETFSSFNFIAYRLDSSAGPDVYEQRLLGNMEVSFDFLPAEKTGSCCLRNGDCLNTTATQCIDQCGIFTPDATCEDTPCVVIEPEAYQCFDAPPDEDGWIATGDCHATEESCERQCQQYPCGDPCSQFFTLGGYKARDEMRQWYEDGGSIGDEYANGPVVTGTVAGGKSFVTSIYGDQARVAAEQQTGLSDYKIEFEVQRQFRDPYECQSAWTFTNIGYPPMENISNVITIQTQYDFGIYSFDRSQLIGTAAYIRVDVSMLDQRPPLDNNLRTVLTKAKFGNQTLLFTPNENNLDNILEVIFLSDNWCRDWFFPNDTTVIVPQEEWQGTVEVEWYVADVNDLLTPIQSHSIAWDWEDAFQQPPCPPCDDTTPTGARTMTTTKTTGGPGTELSKLLQMIGINAKEKGCGCKSHSKRMDQWGPEKCRKEIETILGWLQTEAKKRKLPFVKAAAKQVVLLAIRRAEK